MIYSSSRLIPVKKNVENPARVGIRSRRLTFRESCVKDLA